MILTLCRWRHAIPLSLANLTAILDKQDCTLQELEITMIQPPSAEDVRKFRTAIKHKKFLKLQVFKYHGLSHTEPLPVNRPERGGRCRMVRPLFQKCHQTLQELVLSQDHCISQVGKTPMTLGRTFYDTICKLDDFYIDPSTSSTSTTDDYPPITLHLTRLELGGFHVSTLFDIPPSPLESPPVRISLPHMRRLVLNNCFGLENLLRKLYARKNEIAQLKEFGVRIGTDDPYPNGLSEVFQALRDFLLSFQGLEILSVLVDGDASGLRIGKDVLAHHAKTLRVYSVAARDHEAHDADNTLRFISRSICGMGEKDEISPGCLSDPPCLREYGTFLNKVVDGEYVRLRYLSQFPDLRTVVIRNFPPLVSDLKAVGKKERRFWRDARGKVTFDAIKVAEAFAEQIALPFYAVPMTRTSTEDGNALHSSSGNAERISNTEPESDDSDGDEDRFDHVEENERIRSELEQIAAIHHAPLRDKILGFTPSPHSFSPTPKTDSTRDILKQRARLDAEFRDVMEKVDRGEASLSEQEIYKNYQSLVQVALGVKPAPPELEPKLRMLVVGDWSYRDQMNISGPRRWDPEAWSADSGTDIPTDNEDDVSDMEFQGAETWNWKSYRLRFGFKKEFDISLLPIFFAVRWTNMLDMDKGKWKWKAKVTALRRDTLEGEESLGDVKSLDFAWMN